MFPDVFYVYPRLEFDYFAVIASALRGKEGFNNKLYANV